jgi:hypothetical protein
MARIIKHLTVNEVSAVFRAANPGAVQVLRKSDAPRPGSMQEKYQNLIERLRRGFPDMPIKQVRAEAWEELTPDDQTELLREEREMQKVDTSELFETWYRQLTPEQRRSYQRRQRAIDAELAAEGSSSADSEGRGGGQFNGRPTSPNIAPSAPKAPVFSKGDTITSIVKQEEFIPFCMDVAKSGDAHRVTEDEIMSLASHYAAARNMSLGKFLNSDSAEARYVCKAASVCREGVRARLAERNLFDARERGRQAQHAYLARDI